MQSSEWGFFGGGVCIEEGKVGATVSRGLTRDLRAGAESNTRGIFW
jgi:hypothetical protein